MAAEVKRILAAVLNWKGVEDTIHCFESLLSCRLPEMVHLEILIMDNDSRDNSFEILEKYVQNRGGTKVFKTYKLDEFEKAADVGMSIYLVQNGENLGFAGGINVAFNYALRSNFDYVLLVNNDAEIKPHSLCAALDAFTTDKDIGAIAAKIIVAGTAIIDSAGDGCLYPGKFYKRHQAEPMGSVTARESVFGFCGGGALISTQMLTQVGGFDEDFFINHEDSDLSYRARIAGYKILLEPDFVIEHKVSSSMSKAGTLPNYYSILNADRVYLKNTPWLIMALTFHEKLLYEIISFMYWVLISKKMSVYLKAKRDFLYGLQGTLRKRKLLQNLRCCNSFELLINMDSILNSPAAKKRLSDIKLRLLGGNRHGHAFF
ncbi:glycosyltransferase family 2 protein [Gloeobacter violaceus]|uniref:Glr3786 protein n=1 Tax=Gloeobacter violaceus (strain ATCC 29082 / PCC 7421) TaxID=251221 RepID=Q7NEU2_GLOVI|nr:glycosyltransferase family 2 protein [Gloeobacter violaceus]BAC91727.1 glr3786 [Gloeobacter violaceus PCC 7421]